jgi:hypothetical protein
MLARAKGAELSCEEFGESGKSLCVDINSYEFVMARQRAFGNDLRHDKTPLSSPFLSSAGMKSPH